MATIKETMQNFAINQALKYIEGNPDYQSPESVDHLCDKTTVYANNWSPTAEKLWGCGDCSKCGG